MSKRLISLIFAYLLCIHAGNSSSAESPQWVVHASIPGPDVPPVGNSLFDKLFLQHQDGKAEYAIPYPFDDLIQYLQTRVENESRPSVPRVLIPIGRSLQRNTAAPDFFEFPRTVITLEGEPVTEAGQAGNVLNYRFYIGYQEKSELLEIISYNEEAGRFEFQIADNYRSGETPRVRPASRALCMSCHQNAAPIFARSPWSETNFNPAVGLELIRVNPHKYQSLVAAISDDANAIDLATSRANYLAPSQLFWQSACDGESVNSMASYQCRAGLLRAVLQYRLSGDLAYNSASSAYRTDFVRNLIKNWQLHWPQGLLLPSADIPDRDPFRSNSPDPALDPLSPRPAHAFWEGPTEVLAKGLVYRLAGFFTHADIARLDARLIELASNKIRSYRSSCRVTRDPDSRQSSIYWLHCGDASSAESINAIVEMDYQPRQKTVLRITHLRLPRSPLIWQPTVLSSGLEQNGESMRLDSRLVNASGKLSARLANGNRIASMTLNWSREPEGSADLPDTIEFELIVIKDFNVIDKALENMVLEARQSQSTALSSSPFSRRAIIIDLEKHLGMDPLYWCCDHLPGDLDPSPVAPTSGAEQSAATAVYFDHCAICHGGNTKLPPGFLHGEERQVRQQLAQCAPRIFRRLSLWQEDAQTGVVSPMPPPVSLGFDKVAGFDWPASEAFQQLLDTTRILLVDEAGEANLIRISNTDYENLRPCLAIEKTGNELQG